MIIQLELYVWIKYWTWMSWETANVWETWLPYLILKVKPNSKYWFCKCNWPDYIYISYGKVSNSDLPPWAVKARAACPAVSIFCSQATCLVPVLLVGIDTRIYLHINGCISNTNKLCKRNISQLKSETFYSFMDRKLVVEMNICWLNHAMRYHERMIYSGAWQVGNSW